MTIDGIRPDQSNKLYSSEPEEATCSLDTGKASRANEPKASVLDSWNRLEASYTPGSDAVCNLPPEEPSQTRYLPDSDAMCKSPLQQPSETPEPATPAPASQKPLETYEQCVNRMTYEASKIGSVVGTAAGCAFGAAALSPIGGPNGAIVGCFLGGAAGYDQGGASGAARGEVEAKVKCDHPARLGSPSSKTLEHQMNTQNVHAPIKGRIEQER